MPQKNVDGLNKNGAMPRFSKVQSSEYKVQIKDENGYNWFCKEYVKITAADFLPITATLCANCARVTRTVYNVSIRPTRVHCTNITGAARDRIAGGVWVALYCR